MGGIIYNVRLDLNVRLGARPRRFHILYNNSKNQVKKMIIFVNLNSLVQSHYLVKLEHIRKRGVQKNRHMNKAWRSRTKYKSKYLYLA
jgi:hypothetical protein